MINCVITDDEPIAQQILETYIQKIPNLNLVAKCNNALVTLGVLNDQKVDLLFLDIQMPEISGLDFLKSLKNPPKVIFTTAYQEYALDGYELNVVDYLLKPISFERFLKAVNKVEVSQNEETLPSKEFILLKDGDELIKVKYSEIKYVEGLKDYVKVICENRTIVTLSTMMNMENILPGNFIRVHRSYIVNTDKITSFVGNSVRIEKELISIGKSYKHVLDILKK